MDYRARGATHSPFPSATGEPQPLISPSSWGDGGTTRSRPPARPRQAPRCFVPPRRKRAAAAQSERGQEMHTGLHPPTPRGPPYLRGHSRGTAPCPEHRPRPPLALPGDPNNRPGAERSRARSGTSLACSPPALTSWRGRRVPRFRSVLAGGSLPGTALHGSTAGATCAGNLTPCWSPSFSLA